MAGVGEPLVLVRRVVLLDVEARPGDAHLAVGSRRLEAPEVVRARGLAGVAHRQGGHVHPAPPHLGRQVHGPGAIAGHGRLREHPGLEREAPAPRPVRVAHQVAPEDEEPVLGNVEPDGLHLHALLRVEAELAPGVVDHEQHHQFPALQKVQVPGDAALFVVLLAEPPWSKLLRLVPAAQREPQHATQAAPEAAAKHIRVRFQDKRSVREEPVALLKRSLWLLGSIVVGKHGILRVVLITHVSWLKLLLWKCPCRDVVRLVHCGFTIFCCHPHLHQAVALSCEHTGHHHAEVLLSCELIWPK
mmetsp:Transcript_56891/g.161476  ORF Transcript_56891/g.161476 Transcript_56891/m.161476 type:complete len:302 (+) Transcript_56891:2859-3764(+)